MKKRIFAGLLTLVMVFTLLPVSAMAEAGDWDPLTDPKDVDGSLVGNKTFTASDTLQTGRDGQLKVMPIYQVTSGYTTTTYNAMAYCGAEAASSDTDVVEVKQTDDGKQDIVIGTWEGGDFHGADCLQVNVTPKKAGRAVVTISFYYTFSQNSNPLTSSNTKWFNGTMEYTVNVTEPVAKPDQPDAGIYKGTYGNEGKKYAIVLECDREKTHTYAYKSLKDVENGYTMGEVAVNDGSTGRSPSDYPYICPMTINYAPWVNAVNAQFAKDGEHSLSGTAQSETIYWYYGTDGKWYTTEDDAAPVRIGITCTEPEPDPKPDPKPDKPGDTKPDFKNEKVKIRVQCTEYPSKHDPYTINYGLLPDAYTDKGVTENKGTYFYTIELDKAKYIARFDQDIGKPHTDTEPNEKTYIEWRWENGAWHLIGGPDGVDADIKVKCGQTETPPKAPTADELKKLEMAVQVKCVVDDSQQHKDAYDLLGKYDEDYFVVGPKKVGDDWLCEISYVPDPYVAKFNKTFPTLKHIQNDEKIVPVTLIWAGNSWQLKTQGRIYVTEEYTVTFNAYGGFPTPDEQHVKSGEKAVLPVAPTLKGYTFAFWYLGEDEQTATAYDFDTPVTGDITLTAKWNINKYTVTFDSYGGTPVPPKQEVEYGLTATKPDEPTLKGHTFAFWYLGEDEQNATAYNFDTPVTENITLTAKWNINKYTVTFDSNGGTPVPPAQEVEYGLTAVEPTSAPTKTGYTFDGWYLGNEKYDFTDAVEQDITLKAKWEAIPYGVTYSYVSGTEGADLPWNVIASLPVNKYTYAEGEKVTTAMKPDDMVFGEYTWKFQGWTLDGTAVAPNTQVPMAKGGLHFVGTWIRTSAQDEKYPVTYSYVSGTEGADLPWNVIDSLPVNEYTYAEGEKVTTAMKPDDMGFGEYTWKFQGWTLNGTAVAPNTQVPMAKGGLHFVGTWIRTSAQDEEYPVTYSYVSGVEGVELPEEVKATLPVNKDTYTIGQQVPTAAKPANVTVGDYIWSLKAWKLGDNEIVPNNSVPMVEGGLNFVGIWTREKATVTVTFDANGGTVAPTSKTITKGSTLTLPTPVLSGYSFDGWFTEKTGGTQVNAGATFDKDTTLYAHWTKKSSSGGGGSSSRDYDYTLRYVTNGGKSIASETKSKRWTKDYEDLPMPTRAGYRFDGWYYDSALKNEVTGDVKVNSRTVTLYAGWIGSSVPDSLNGEDHFAYVQGYADGTVRPNTPVTRAQVATILFRLLDESVRKEYLTENNTFTDVASNYWANTAISTMANMGVFKGRTADRFDPNAPITRGEFAAVCARFDDSKVKTTETYSDIDGYWAANEILRAAALGWVQGYQDGSYRPNNSITRAQVVTMINRVLCRMPEKNADLLKGMSSFTDCAEDDWCYLAIQEATNSHDYKTKSGSIHEKWTDLNTAPDWSRFEH